MTADPLDAVIEFLSADAGRINNVFRLHRRDINGLCTAHDVPHPCWLRQQAEAAKVRFTAIPLPRGAME